MPTSKCIHNLHGIPFPSHMPSHYRRCLVYINPCLCGSLPLALPFHSVNEVRQARTQPRSAGALYDTAPRQLQNWNWQDPKPHCPLTHHRGLRGGTQPQSKFRSKKADWGI